jgi:putative Mn2+ efflux pump MntP
MNPNKKMTAKWSMLTVWVIFSVSFLTVSALFPSQSRFQYWLSLLAPIGFLLMCILGLKWISKAQDIEDAS